MAFASTERQQRHTGYPDFQKQLDRRPAASWSTPDSGRPETPALSST